MKIGCSQIWMGKEYMEDVSACSEASLLAVSTVAL